MTRFWKQQQRRGHCRPKQIGGYRRSRLRPHEKTLRQWIKRQADLTLVELQERCRTELEVTIGLTALWHRLDRLGLSYKKNDARRRASAARRQGRAAALAAAQPQWDSARLVFIDETGLNTKMARLLRPLAPKAAAASQLCPTATGKARPSSPPYGRTRSTAPFLIEGAVNAEVFTAYLRQVLCPELQADDIVILDNLSTHKMAGVAGVDHRRRRDASATFRAYSPDLNPIEMAFAKLKAHLRRPPPAPSATSKRRRRQPRHFHSRSLPGRSFAMPNMRLFK